MRAAQSRLLPLTHLRNSRARNPSIRVGQNLALYSPFSAWFSVLPFVQTVAMCTARLVITLLQITALVGRFLFLHPNCPIHEHRLGRWSRGLRDHHCRHAHFCCKLCASVRRLSWFESTSGAGTLTVLYTFAVPLSLAPNGEMIVYVPELTVGLSGNDSSSCLTTSSKLSTFLPGPSYL